MTIIKGANEPAGGNNISFAPTNPGVINEVEKFANNIVQNVEELLGEVGPQASDNVIASTAPTDAVPATPEQIAFLLFQQMKDSTEKLVDFMQAHTTDQKTIDEINDNLELIYMAFETLHSSIFYPKPKMEIIEKPLPKK